VPLFYQNNIDENTRLAVWKIEEEEKFFSAHVPVQREITHPHKRLQHLAGRYLIRHLYPQFPHHEIEIAGSRKPFLASEQYHFSISHCADYAAVVVSTSARVSVDVEVVTPRVANIKNKFLHADELRFVNSRQPALHTELLTILWSAKEAMFKWYGLGEVDFSEMLRTLPFEQKEAGIIDGFIDKFPLQQKLIMHYKVWNNIVLVWISSE